MRASTKILGMLLIAATVAAAAPNAGETAPELGELWKDPTFQKDFMGSFGTNSDIEPSLSLVEREAMQVVLQKLQEGDTAGAKAELLRLIDPPAPQRKRKGDAEVATLTPNALYDFTLANLHFQEGDLDAAKPYYQSALAKFPAFRRAHKNLGLIQIRQGEYREAIAELSRVIEDGGGDGLTYGLLGYAYASDGQYLSAESAFRNALLLQRDQLNWKVGLTQAVLKQQRWAEAVTLCEELIAGDPSRPDFWLLQSNAWIGLGKPLEAAKNYEILDRMGQAPHPALNTLGDIYVNEKMWDLAVRAYGRAMELDPAKDPRRPIQAAEALAQRGAMTQARDLTAQIRSTLGPELDAEQKKKLLKLEARMAVAGGGGGDAVAVLEEIVALDPLDGEALMLLGRHYAEAEDIERAIFYFERAQGIDLYEADARLRHAQLLVGEGRYDEAMPLLKRSQELEPRDDVARYMAQVERIARTSR